MPKAKQAAPADPLDSSDNPPALWQPPEQWTEIFVKNLGTIDLSEADARPVTSTKVPLLCGLLLASQRDDCSVTMTNTADGFVRQALLNFQRIKGLTPDAICGQETWLALLNP